MFAKSCSYKFCKIDRKIPLSEQAWNFAKKENPAQVLSCDFYDISGRLLYRYYLNYQFFEVFFFLIYPMCVYGSFGLLCIWFCFTYRVLTIIQKFWLSQSLYFVFVDWIRCYLVLFFESVNECKKEKKREKSSECFTHGSGKTIRIFNQVPAKIYWATKLKLSLTIS